MAKSETIRGRVSNVLKTRLDKFIKSQAARGRTLTESSVLDEALVEYLDKKEGKPKGCGTDAGCAGHPEEIKFSANDKPAQIPGREVKPVSYQKK